MARTRTTKKIAQRIDLNYFKRPTKLKRAKFWVSILAPLLALVWIGEHAILKDARVYSSGRLSRPHAVLERNCAACHLQTAGAFSAKALDSACLGCHDGPAHHASRTATPACAECHSEHRGRIRIAAVGDGACAACHADLDGSQASAHYALHIRSLEDGHPEFAAVRPVASIAVSDRGTIKLNHAIHMKAIRRGPTGPNVELECGNCHRSTASAEDVTYGDAQYRGASVSHENEDEFLTIRSVSLAPARSPSGRELMAPVKFANACAGCHLLTFDKRFEFGVPHDKPEIVEAFLSKTFREYIATHPAEVRVERDANRELTGKPLFSAVRVLTPIQWVMERTAEAEDLLWRKTCKQCHTLMRGDNSSRTKNGLSSAQLSEAGKISTIAAELPGIAPANTTLKWMPHAKFDHGAHEGFTCVSCHAKALTSTESSDVLLPGIATCKKCHAPGPEHAESRCFECHTYHDWSKRKEIAPTFTLPALRSGGE